MRSPRHRHIRARLLEGGEGQAGADLELLASLSFAIQSGYWLEQARPRLEDHPCPLSCEKNGFEFFFWSNDHSPAHIHVFKAGGEAKFNLEPLVELVYTRRMKVADISQAQRLVKQHHAFLLKAFQEHEDRK